MLGEFSSRILGGQKVADNRKATAPVKCFEVAWKSHHATIGSVVGITAKAHLDILNKQGLRVEIFFNKKPYAVVENVSVQGRNISAAWKVKPLSTVNVEQQIYHVRVSYNGGLTGETNNGLRVSLLDMFEHAPQKTGQSQRPVK